jgi:hypothetical protein
MKGVAIDVGAIADDDEKAAWNAMRHHVSEMHCARDTKFARSSAHALISQ